MTEDKKKAIIEDNLVEIVSDVQTFDPGGHSQAVVLTGFVNVESIVRLGFIQQFFIEKKLPFQILIIRRPTLPEREE